MSKGKRKPAQAPRDGGLGPTPERARHGELARVPQAIADEAGRPSRPYRSMDTLALMLRKGSITAPMKQAGDDFRTLFALAGLETLRALDLARVPQGWRDMPLSLVQVDARRKVWQALEVLGGIASPAGSCVWHVIGCEWTVKDWALREGWGGRPLRDHTAAGVLIGALGVLQAHFGL